MYPKRRRNPPRPRDGRSLQRNPEAAAARGLWGDPDFLEKVAELNPKLKDTQFADYHGHGWVFRAVFKKDREGNLLDARRQDHRPRRPREIREGGPPEGRPPRPGMQCVDCHFQTDEHGNGLLYGEPRNATTIECVDCHGTIDQRPTLVTSGKGGHLRGRPSSQPVDISPGHDAVGPALLLGRAEALPALDDDPDVVWEIPQTIDTIDPASRTTTRSPPTRRRSARRRHLGRRPATAPSSERGEARPRQFQHGLPDLPHLVGDELLRLPPADEGQQAVRRTSSRARPAATTRATIPQVVRDDVFMLGRDGTVQGPPPGGHPLVERGRRRLAERQPRMGLLPAADGLRRGLQRPGLQSPFPAHDQRRGTTKNCTDCHLSAAEDNNAIMAQLLGFGTGTVNFFGRYAYVGAGRTASTPSPGPSRTSRRRHRQPPPAPGLPRRLPPHVEADHRDPPGGAYHHDGEDIQDLVLRGEYLYTANGPGGFEVFDVANVDNKGFSERIVSAPVSPLGQRLWVRRGTPRASSLPSTQAVDPLRTHRPENEEQPISRIYGYVYVTDRYEGLVTVMVGTLLDGDPTDNFFRESDVTRFNPGGALDGATHAFMAGPAST
jgi:hypothetical protein